MYLEGPIHGGGGWGKGNFMLFRSQSFRVVEFNIMQYSCTYRHSPTTSEFLWEPCHLTSQI